MRKNIGWKITTFVLLVCLVVVAAVYHRLLFPQPQAIVPGIGPLNADGTVKYPHAGGRGGRARSQPGPPPGREDRGARGTRGTPGGR